MKADYVHKDTRTIVVDGVEIQTSLSAVEIADLHQKNQELHNKIDKAIETIEGWHFALDWAENDRLKIIKEILKDSDVDE